MEVAIQENLERLLREEDTDGDQRITIRDPRLREAGRGDRRFALVSLSGRRYEVHGTYYLSNLLQELKLAEERDSATAEIDLLKVFENPVRRISRSIRDVYWDNLTRRIDADLGRGLVEGDRVTGRGPVRRPVHRLTAHDLVQAFRVHDDRLGASGDAARRIRALEADGDGRVVPAGRVGRRIGCGGDQRRHVVEADDLDDDAGAGSAVQLDDQLVVGR